MATVYMSPNPYFDMFVEPIDLRKVDLTLHQTAGLKLFERNGHLILREVHITLVGSLGTSPLCPLLFAFPEICQNISHDGLPIMHSGDLSQATHNQLNEQWDYFTLFPCMQRVVRYSVDDSRGVLNSVTRVMRLTWGKLLKQNDWHDWCRIRNSFN
jgi:hypothetical protein